MNDAIAWHSAIAAEFEAKYARSRAFQERLAVWSALIERFAGPQADVLDAGCGTGILSRLAARRARSVLGFDASAQMIEVAEERRKQHYNLNTTFRVGALGDATVLGSRRFDLILCSSVLEYVEDYWAALEWLAAALKPNGVLVLSMPNGRSIYRKAERIAFRLTGRPAYYEHVRNVPSFNGLRAGLAVRGFEIAAVQYYAATPVLSGIARALGRPELADALFAVACRRPVGHFEPRGR